MTGLLIVCGLAGLNELAADIAITQAVTLALFSAFSANARNLILKSSSPLAANQLLYYRLIFLLPLLALAYWLSSISNVNAFIALILLLRRSIEWLDEIFLSEMERLNHKKVAFQYFVMQSLLLAFALVWLLTNMPFPLFGILLWAISPLGLSGRFYLRMPNTGLDQLYSIVRRISPHIGSTAVIGITVYVFRLLMIDLLGKPVAGDLFVAFAIGGILGSVIANAFGPTMVFAQQANNHIQYPTLLKILMTVFFIMGTCLIFTSPMLVLFNKTPLFWQAVGLSMIGAVPMVIAQLTRHRLLQTHDDHDLFGPDVLMNVFLVAIMPLVYYLLGIQCMAAMYLFSSVLAWLFYKSYESYELGHLAHWRKTFAQMTPLLVCLLVLPVFFQFGSGIFTAPDLFFDSNRSISRLPFPFSIMANFAILLGIGAFSRARVSLLFIFVSFVLMTVAVVISTPAATLAQESKFIQIAQFTLPMFALISGQFFEENKNQSVFTFEKIFFYTILLVVSLQLACTLLAGSATLLPSLKIFSIYQYLHYVPVMFIISYTFIFERLWRDAFKPVLLLLLWALLALYSVMTGSLFIVATYIVCMLSYVVFFGKLKQHKPLKVFLGMIFITITAFTYHQHSNLTKNVDLAAGPVSMITKVQYGWDQKSDGWGSHLEAIYQHPQTFLVGHSHISARGSAASPHNYYLDFIYNFGVVGLLPLFALIVFTVYKTWTEYRQVICNSHLLYPLLSIVFLLFIENTFYMGLKQPYPGILSFFLWGIYLSRIDQPKKRIKSIV
ncbi:MAG: hypothetical protein ACTS9Y_12215 [Methylophilus sp.]|uniref:hypothetical protein n=1 Tax=Methylophilus sp. TaxID=29541 RepID=UPI003FA0D9C7